MYASTGASREVPGTMFTTLPGIVSYVCVCVCVCFLNDHDVDMFESLAGFCLNPIALNLFTSNAGRSKAEII